MGRRHKRKLGARRYKDYSNDVLQEALNDIDTNNVTFREAAEKYNISKSTLQRKMEKKNMRAPGRPCLLAIFKEEAMVDNIKTLAQWGFHLSLLDLRMFAKEVLDTSGEKIPQFKENLPGIDWAYSFLERHKKQLTVRLCQNIKANRAKTDCEALLDCFKNLQKVIENVPPTHICNFDETNLSDDPGKKKMIFNRHVRHPERIINSSKSSTSVMYAFTANGDLLPDYVVYKSAQLWNTWIEGGPKGTCYNRSKSGWFDVTCFKDWFHKIIIPWARKLKGKKVVIGDNVSSHFSQEVLSKCQEMNIAFVCLPPNSTHILQPLDVAFFRPLKSHWLALLEKWKIKEHYNVASLPKNEFPAMLKQLREKMAPNARQNIESGFEASGIYPLAPERVSNYLVCLDKS